MSIGNFGLAVWDPIIWVIALIVVAIIVGIIRSRGQKQYKKGTGQTKIFLCGEEEPDAEQRHIRAHNIYWGFFETLKGYYDTNMKLHTGIVNDYVLWFVALVAISIMVLFIAGAP